MTAAEQQAKPDGSDGKGRPWLRRALAVTTAASLAAVAVHNSAGFALAPLNPLLAASIAPGHSATLSYLTQFRFFSARSRDQLPGVRSLARATVQAAPLDHAAARTVAALDIIAGRQEAAENVFTIVGANTLRDAMTHAWLLNSAYRERDFDRVVRHADIVLRLDAKLRPAAFAALNELVADGRVIPALVKALETSPEWRTAYLTAMGQERGSRDNQLQLLRSLRSGPTPPTAEELRTFFLVDGGRVSIEDLARTFAELSPTNFGPAEIRIRDAKFEGTGSYGPFGWVYYPGENGFAEAGASPSGGGKSLYLDFEGRQDAVVATQFLTVAPGTYTLALRSFALSELRGQTQLLLSCQQTPTIRQPLASLPVQGTVNAWQTRRWQFTVPEGCSGPILDIGWRPATVSRPEQLYIDDIIIQPVAAAE
jgi:hypothetical protein